jgi:hypothetical protein
MSNENRNIGIGDPFTQDCSDFGPTWGCCVSKANSARCVCMPDEAECPEEGGR